MSASPATITPRQSAALRLGRHRDVAGRTGHDRGMARLQGKASKMRLRGRRRRS